MPAQNPVTAIDIVLEPDATMKHKAAAANARLLQNFPQGFALDESHQPHISVLMRYARMADLENVYAAVGRLLDEETPTRWKLKAYRYYYLPDKQIGLAGIVIEPTEDVLRFQQKLIDATALFSEKTATAAAFVTTKEEPDINQPTLDYVANYIPAYSGKKYNPHVTIGVGTQEFLQKMLDEKFDTFTFSPSGVSIYHLGNMGTAREKLKGWLLTS
jgi:hypothetical protein